MRARITIDKKFANKISDIIARDKRSTSFTIGSRHDPYMGYALVFDADHPMYRALTKQGIPMDDTVDLFADLVICTANYVVVRRRFLPCWTIREYNV
jgi:hypothetical protein